MKGVGDEAVQVVVQEAPDRAKAEYIVARRGNLVAAVGDEELVLDPGTPNEKQASLKLTHDEKLARLTAWLDASEVEERESRQPRSRQKRREGRSQERSGRTRRFWDCPRDAQLATEPTTQPRANARTPSDLPIFLCPPSLLADLRLCGSPLAHRRCAG